MTAVTASVPAYGRPFWERMWRSAGLQSAVLFAIAYFLCGSLPRMNASSDAIVSVYAQGRTGIYVGAAVGGLAVLNLAWFAAAIRAALADAGQDGWGGAVTAASAAVAAVLLLLMTIAAAVVHSAANGALVSGLNDMIWSALVVSSFPRAMLIMATSFGFWRAGLISNALFTVAVAAVVFVLAGGTTWFDAGPWSPDGIVSATISPIVCLVWLVAASAILLGRVPGASSGW